MFLEIRQYFGPRLAWFTPEVGPLRCLLRLGAAHPVWQATESVMQGSLDLALVSGLVSQLAQVSVVLLALAVVAAAQRSHTDPGLVDTSRSAL